jgi:hypothetical protein
MRIFVFMNGFYLRADKYSFISSVNAIKSSVFGGLFVAAIVLFASCDEEPPAIRSNEKPLLDTTYTSAPPSPQTKKVLLIDITGVRCSNCPRAAETAKSISSANLGRVEVLAIYPHIGSGVLTNPWDGNDTLVIPEALDLLVAKPTTLPRGMVDNIDYNGNKIIDEINWSTAVAGQITKTTPVNIELTTQWLNSEDKARIQIKAIANQATNRKLSWVIGITEDKIVGKQSDSRLSNGVDEEYEFEHVLRQVVSSTSGDVIAEQGFASPGITREKHYFIPRKSKWKKENLKCIVWVMDADTKEVLTVATAKLVP